MTRDDVCTCGLCGQCPTCGKSRRDYEALMVEHEALTAYVRALRHGVDRLAELELDTFLPDGWLNPEKLDAADWCAKKPEVEE